MILSMRKIRWKKLCLLVNHTVLSQKLITAFWFGFGTGDVAAKLHIRYDSVVPVLYTKF